MRRVFNNTKKWEEKINSPPTWGSLACYADELFFLAAGFAGFFRAAFGAGFRSAFFSSGEFFSRFFCCHEESPLSSAAAEVEKFVDQHRVMKLIGCNADYEMEIVASRFLSEFNTHVYKFFRK